MALGSSDAARFQAYQTRARMGIALWRQVLMLTLFAWTALTIYVVWWVTGRYFPRLDHQYFWQWLIAGSLVRTPFIGRLASFLSLPISGSWYRLGPLTDWLNGTAMYQLPPTYWLWHYGTRTALIPITLGVAALVWRSGHRLDALHLRGLKLLTDRKS